MGDDDARLVRSVLAGNQDEYRVLVARYWHTARRWASNYVNDQARSEEVVQEAFVEAYTRLETLQRPDRFAGWLHSIVTYLAIATLRRRKGTIDFYAAICREHSPDNTYQDADQHQRLERREREFSVHAAVDRLSPVHRQVITLYYFDNCSQQRIAQLLRSTPKAIKSLLHRARQQLRKEMSDHDG